MLKYFEILRFNHLFKNLLILTPVFTYGGFEYRDNSTLFLKAFLIFSCINLLCYLVNDFTDQEIDKINKLKKKINLNHKEFLTLILILFCLNIFLLLFFDFYDNFYVYLYFVNFFIYNFFAKKIKYLDLIFLNNFYIIRILYGSYVFKIDLTIGFLIFFITLFMGLSLSKRVTQIQINQLKPGNSILKYSLDDLRYLLKYIFVFFSISFVSYFFYIINNFNSYIADLNLFKVTNHPKDFLIILLFIFIIWIVRTMKLLRNNLIDKDFYKFFIKDKFSYLCLMILIIYLIISNVY